MKNRFRDGAAGRPSRAPGPKGAPPRAAPRCGGTRPPPPLSSGLILSTMGCGSLHNGCDPLQGATDRVQGVTGRLQSHESPRVRERPGPVPHGHTQHHSAGGSSMICDHAVTAAAVVAVLPVPKQAVCGRRCSPRSAAAARSSGAAWKVSSRTTKTWAWAARSGKGTREPQVGRERRTGGASHGRPRPLRCCLSHGRRRGTASSARARHQEGPAPLAPAATAAHNARGTARRQPEDDIAAHAWSVGSCPLPRYLTVLYR